MKKPSVEFLLTVIVLLVIFAGTQQYLIHGYEGITDKLLNTVDQLLKALSTQMRMGKLS